MINDFIHMVAVAVWVGGLFSLALGIPAALRLLDERERREALSALIPRFSVGRRTVRCGASVDRHLQRMDTGHRSRSVGHSVWNGADGQGWAGCGAACDSRRPNLVWVRPRLFGDSRAAYWLRRLVAVEVVIVIVVLLSVGFLTSLEPARQAAARLGIGVEDRLTFSDTAEGAEMTLEVIPGRVGPNTIEVTLRDGFGNPITNATDVRARLSYLDADLGETAVSATSVGDGEFTLTDQVIGIAGAWEVALVVQRPDAFDAADGFQVRDIGRRRIY